LQRFDIASSTVARIVDQNSIFLWQVIQIDAAMIFTRADFVSMSHLILMAFHFRKAFLTPSFAPASSFFSAAAKSKR